MSAKGTVFKRSTLPLSQLGKKHSASQGVLKILFTPFLDHSKSMLSLSPKTTGYSASVPHLPHEILGFKNCFTVPYWGPAPRGGIFSQHRHQIDLQINLVVD
jgi:hypothetical protein